MMSGNLHRLIRRISSCMLEISYKYLKMLDGADYKKYRRLKNKKFEGEFGLKLLYVLLHITLASIAGVIGFLFTPNWYGWFFVYLVGYPFAFLLSYGAGVFLEKTFKIQKHIAEYEKKSRKYEYFQQLRRRYLSIEMEIEEQLKEYNEKGFPELIKLTTKNAGNQEFFDNLVEIFRANHLFIEAASKTLGKSSYQTKYREQLRRNQLLDYRSGLIFTKWDKKKGTIPQITPGGWGNILRRKIYYPRAKKHSRVMTLGDITAETKPKTQPVRPAPKYTPPVKNTKDDATVKNVTSSQNENSEIDWNLVTETETPKKKARKSSATQTIKASEKFWKELGERKIEIGKKGELLVMEFERNRIAKEFGDLFLCRLNHSAVNEGDGLGYDITSFSDGKEIYIEVKTTTGNFWNGLIFTKNELNAMRELGEYYYLYRIYNFDMDSNSGNLKIFKGRVEIEKEFNFSPQTFLLEPKA
jgi:hypothetical protein